MQYNNMEISEQTEPPVPLQSGESLIPSTEQVMPSEQAEVIANPVVEQLPPATTEAFTPLPMPAQDYREMGDLARMLEVMTMKQINPTTESEHIAVQSEPKMTVLQKIGHLLKNLFTFWRKKDITPQLPSSLPEAS